MIVKEYGNKNKDIKPYGDFILDTMLD